MKRTVFVVFLLIMLPCIVWAQQPGPGRPEPRYDRQPLPQIPPPPGPYDDDDTVKLVFVNRLPIPIILKVVSHRSDVGFMASISPGDNTDYHEFATGHRVICAWDLDGELIILYQSTFKRKYWGWVVELNSKCLTGNCAGSVVWDHP